MWCLVIVFCSLSNLDLKVLYTVLKCLDTLGWALKRWWQGMWCITKNELLRSQCGASRTTGSVAQRRTCRFNIAKSSYISRHGHVPRLTFPYLKSSSALQRNPQSQLYRKVLCLHLVSTTRITSPSPSSNTLTWRSRIEKSTSPIDIRSNTQPLPVPSAP